MSATRQLLWGAVIGLVTSFVILPRLPASQPAPTKEQGGRYNVVALPWDGERAAMLAIARVHREVREEMARADSVKAARDTMIAPRSIVYKHHYLSRRRWR